MKKQKPKKLTPTHWAVYNAVLQASKEGRDIGQEEICSKTPLFYQEVTKHGDHCRELWDIVQDINDSPEVDKMIYADRYRYRIATEEEARRYAAKLFDKAIRLLRRRAAITRKMGQDGQGKAIMPGSQAKPFHESYLEEAE